MGKSSSYKPKYYRGTHAGSGEKELEKSQPSFFNNRSYPVQSETSSPFFQTKLSIGRPNDQYEQEADRVADKVVNQKDTATVVQQKEISSVQRLATSEEDEKVGTNDARMLKDKEIQEKPDVKEENEEVQTKSEGNASAPASLSSRISNSSGKGTSLPSKTLHQMNSSFGVDFSGVNIHTDQSSIRMNKELRSQAFTHGRDIYFNSGKYNPETSTGKQLLAHELTHVIQQGSGRLDSVQRSCSDGACDSCFGGKRDFWITFYFRRKATRKTMTYLRQQINEAKRVLANCCLTLKADFNWKLLQGGGTFNFMNTNADGSWQYSADASGLGTGTTFEESKGIPVLVVDDVPHSGGGVTVDTSFDPNYQGQTYAVVGVTQTNPNPGCNHLAHELWHVGSGIVGHDVAHGTLAACQGNDVSPEFCRGLRNIVAPVGDFPVPSQTTAVA